jgi:flagellin-like hook-associated protein FlgL
MIELVTKYGSTGYHTSEYMAAGARINALDALRTQQLGDTAMNPIALALTAVKTEAMAAGFTGVTATKIGRAIAARGQADTVTVGGNFALAAALAQADGDTAGELDALTTRLNTELQSAAAEAATMSAAAKMFNDAATATGFRAAGYSAGASASGVDFGKETAALAAAQIRAQAATAMVAQSSVIDQSALALLQ